MGKRVENIYKNSSLSWNEFKKHLQEFSKTIDDDFKAAYKEMTNEVGSNLKSGTLKELKLSDNDFPVRRIITAGDDGEIHRDADGSTYICSADQTGYC